MHFKIAEGKDILEKDRRVDLSGKHATTVHFPCENGGGNVLIRPQRRQDKRSGAPVPKRICVKFSLRQEAMEITEATTALDK